MRTVPPAAADAHVQGTTVITWMLLFQIASALGWLVLPVALPRALRTLGQPEIWVAHLSGFMFFCAVLPTLASSGLCRRWGPTGLTQRAVALCALGLLTLGTGTLPSLVAGVTLIGLGYGAAAPGASVLMQHYVAPRRRALAFSIRQAGVPLAGLAIGLVAAPCSSGCLCAPSCWRSRPSSRCSCSPPGARAGRSTRPCAAAWPPPRAGPPCSPLSAAGQTCGSSSLRALPSGSCRTPSSPAWW